MYGNPLKLKRLNKMESWTKEEYFLRTTAMARLLELRKLGFKTKWHSEGTKIIVEFSRN